MFDLVALVGGERVPVTSVPVYRDAVLIALGRLRLRPTHYTAIDVEMGGELLRRFTADDLANTRSLINAH